MTASVADVENGICTNLSSLFNGRTFTYLPDNFQAPCVIVGCTEIEFHGQFDNNSGPMQMSATVLVARPSDRASQASTDAYMSKAGGSSVAAAIEADKTLGGVVNQCIVTKAKRGPIVDINGTIYLALDFDITVYP